MSTFHAVVIDVRLSSRSGVDAVWWLALDPTAFAPGDRGVLEAETRSGKKLTIPVTSIVVDEDGMLWHVVEKPVAAGTDVAGTVNAPS